MYLQEQYRACRNASKIFALIAITLPILFFQAAAEASENVIATSPFKFKQYYISYDVSADGTYIETGNFAKAVLTQRGVLLSQQIPIGLPNSGMDMGIKKDIEVLTAYTLKKSGEHVAAIQAESKENNEAAASGVLPIPGFFQPGMKSIAFQKVEIGDTLVFSYKIIRGNAVPPGNVVIDQFFPKFVAYDDVMVSLTAPVSLELRAETEGIDKAENLGTAKIQKLVWKYQNKNPVAIPDQRQATSFNLAARIHISSFKDNAAEMEALPKQAAVPFTPPFPKNKGCMVLGDIPHDGPAGMDALSGAMAIYFWNNESWLDGVVNEWKNPKCILDDGRPMLGALKYAYESIFDTQTDWSVSLSRVEYLKKKYPNTAFVALAEADYWTNYAWDARGGGFASSVTPDGLKLFRERLEKAEKVLIDSRSYASQLPGWYDEMIIVQSALGRPEDERDQTFLEATRKYKYYYPTYITMMNYLSPKWGGSWGTVENLIKWSVDNTKEMDGSSMYARLYSSTATRLPPGVDLFKETQAKWPKMKQGFEDMMARHPKSKWNLNNFAKFACMANDKKTFLMLRRQMGKDVMDAAWPQNTSLDLCETKFGYSQQ